MDWIVPLLAKDICDGEQGIAQAGDLLTEVVLGGDVEDAGRADVSPGVGRDTSIPQGMRGRPVGLAMDPGAGTPTSVSGSSSAIKVTVR